MLPAARSLGPPGGLRTARSREQAAPLRSAGRGYRDAQGQLASRSPPGPESGGRGKSCGGHPSPSSAVSRGQPSAAVYFVIKSIKLPLSYKTGAGGEGGGGGLEYYCGHSFDIVSPKQRAPPVGEMISCRMGNPRNTRAISLFYFV